MAAPTLAKRKAYYDKLIKSIKVSASRKTQINNAVNLVLKNKKVYQEVEKLSGVPWAFIGVLHYRESACNMDGVLHNGEKIIGTGRKTKLVPKNRGPFTSWVQAAVDALSIKGWTKSKPSWSLEQCLFQGERYNGWGYYYKNINSPYLWSGTNHYTKGKYIADHVWSPTAVDKQLGIVPVMLALQEKDKDVSWGNPIKIVPKEEPKEVELKDVDLEEDLTEPEIRAIQRRLRELGYNEVTWVDGKFGDRTKLAIKLFQRDNDLPDTGLLTKTTLAMLVIATPRVNTPLKEGVTIKDLRKAGDKIVKASWLTRITSWLLGGSAIGVGAMDALPEASEHVATIQSVITGVPPWGWSIILVLIAIIIWRETTRIDKAKIEDIETGKDIGPIMDMYDKIRGK